MHVTKCHNQIPLQATHDIYRLSSPPLHSSPPPQLPDTGDQDNDDDDDDDDFDDDIADGDDDNDDSDNSRSTPLRPRNSLT